MRLGRLEPNDLLIKNIDEGLSIVIPNGFQLMRDLDELSRVHGYKLTSHSSNAYDDQMEQYHDINAACRREKLPIPPLHAIAVFDNKSEHHKRCDSGNPVIRNDNGVTVVTWGADQENGKASLRRALEVALTIRPDERANSAIFDDAPNVIEHARIEGYQGFEVSNATQGSTLSDHVHHVLLQARAKLAQEQRQHAAPSRAAQSQPSSAGFFSQPPTPRVGVRFEDLSTAQKAFLSEYTSEFRHTVLAYAPFEDLWRSLGNDPEAQKPYLEAFDNAVSEGSFHHESLPTPRR